MCIFKRRSKNITMIFVYFEKKEPRSGQSADNEGGNRGRIIILVSQEKRKTAF